MYRRWSVACVAVVCVLLPIIAHAQCSWSGSGVYALSGSGCTGLTVPGDISVRPGAFGMVLGKVGLWLGTNDNYSTGAYFGMQKAPTGYANDFAIVGANDAGTQRWLRFGYNASDNPSSTFYSKAAINIYTGAMTLAGPMSVDGDLSTRPLRFGIILNKINI